MNKNLDSALQLLSPIQAKHSQTGLTWADLIVLAGTTALEVTNNNLSLPFCAGRVDDTEGRAWEYLEPRITGNFSDSLVRLKDYISVMGLTQREFAALLGAGHVIGEDRDCAGLYCRYRELLYLLLHLNNFFITRKIIFLFCFRRDSFVHKETSSAAPVLSNKFFKDLLSDNWEVYHVPGSSMKLFTSERRERDVYIYKTDLMFKWV